MPQPVGAFDELAFLVVGTLAAGAAGRAAFLPAFCLLDDPVAAVEAHLAGEAGKLDADRGEWRQVRVVAVLGGVASSVLIAPEQAD